MTTTLNKTINYGVAPGLSFGFDPNLVVTNAGAINGNTYAIYGSVLISNVSVINDGHLTANDLAVLVDNGSDSILNQGVVSGGLAGVYLHGGQLTNSGQVSGGEIGVLAHNSATALLGQGGSVYGTVEGVYLQGSRVYNDGSLSSGTIGALVSSGYFDNELSGAVNGHTAGVTEKSGSVMNAGAISGITAGAAIVGYGSFVNDGTIGGLGAGFVLDDTVPGAQLQNNGQIAGFAFGAIMSGGTFVNTGTVNGGTCGTAVYLGTLLNQGSISGARYGVSMASGFLLNGDLLGQGEVSGGVCGIYQSAGNFLNLGTVSSGTIGAAFGIVSASNFGVITGGEAGVVIGGGVLADPGTISGGLYAIDGYNAFDLVLGSNSRLTGKVADQDGDGEITLAGTGGAGSLDMGGSFSGFSAIDFVGIGGWTLEGNESELAAGQAIGGFTLGDTLLLDGFSATADSYAAGSGLILSDAASSVVLGLQGDFSTYDFAVTDVAGGTEIAAAVPCFCPGTRIATARGNIAVERLQVGDLVRTAAGGMQPVRWIGRRAYDGRFIAGNHLALPIKIRRHALGFNVPARDLHVSPGHAICEGGVLVHAWRLVNGVSITQAAAVERVEYFHIELDAHAVIFAENAPVESFLDNGCRAQFQAAQGVPAAGALQQPCLPLIEDGYYLARLQQRLNTRAGIAPPAAGTGPLRGYIDRTRPLLCGWAQDEAAPEVAVELELLCGGQPVRRFLANRFRADLRAAGCGSGCHAFELPAPALPGPFTLRRVADGAVLEQYGFRLSRGHQSKAMKIARSNMTGAGA